LHFTFYCSGKKKWIATNNSSWQVPEHHPTYPRLHAIKFLSMQNARDPLSVVGHFCKALKTLESCDRLKEDLDAIDNELALLCEDGSNDNDFASGPLPAMEYDEDVYGCLKSAFGAVVCECGFRVPQEICLRVGMLASAQDKDDRTLEILAFSDTGTFWQEVTVHVSIPQRLAFSLCHLLFHSIIFSLQIFSSCVVPLPSFVLLTLFPCLLV
jgi:hypothetical protein